MSDTNLNSQSTFWQSMMKKYANQNLKLQEEKCHLTHQLKVLDDCLPSDKTDKCKQNFDITNFLSQFDKPESSVVKYVKNWVYGTFVARASVFPVEAQIKCSSQQHLKSETDSSCKFCLSKENQNMSTSERASKIGICNACIKKSSSILKSMCDDNDLSDINFDQLKLDESGGASLDSVDVLYMLKLKELVGKEKKMALRIQELENKEQEYKEVLQQADEKWAMMEDHYKEQFLQVKLNEDKARMKFERLSAQLLEENSRLTDEVKKIKMELLRCMSQVQEPMCRQLNEERRKSETLERNLRLTNDAFSDNQFMHKKGMDKFQEKLNWTSSNMKEITSTNELLKKEIHMMKSRYDELQEDLRNQQVSEARTLKRLDEALSSMNNSVYKE